MKRTLDIAFSTLVLAAAAPIILAALLAVWLYDRHSPLYRAKRAGLHNQNFEMLKIRSMRVDAERMGGTSTAGDDPRITPVGRYIRRFKLDEICQFWNVIKGDMSVVGPRPNTRQGGVDLYTPEEMHLLDLRPGVTDFASIVFSDEGEILRGAADPDALYNRAIRPWKSRLGLLYVQHHSVALDVEIIALTALALVSKPRAVRRVQTLIKRLGASDDLVAVCGRQTPLVEVAVPGATVQSSP